MKRRDFILSSAAFAGLSGVPLEALAQDRRKELLIVANETGPNSLDIHTVGANRAAYGVSWICYDRLMTFARKTVSGQVTYDYTKLEPELAESWTIAPDGLSVTFKLRKDAKFHDGTPVTARDVKWSYDRAVTVGGFPTFQMKAGSLEKPEQFSVVDDHTFKVTFPRKDKLSMNDMAVPVPSIFNAALVKKHATPDDPWGLNWTKNNVAGSGAYKVEAWRPGQEIVYVRNDDWKCGPMPKLRRIVQREIPSAGNRRALLTKGDIDMTYELPPKDFLEMAQEKGDVRVVSTPIENALWYVGMNVTRPPFNNPRIRQAVAYAIPYEKVMDNAMYKRATKMWGGASGISTPAWPQPTPYKQDLAKAKELMKAAGITAPIETTLSFDLGQGTVSEPACILVQEALREIGINATINKVPGANWRAALLKKDMPMILNRFGGWLNYPEYFFFWCYHGQNAVFNTMSYQSPEMDRLIDAARFEADPKKYVADVKGFIEMAWTDVPRIPLAQPNMDVAMQKNIQGYQYWFHLQPDYRQLSKA